MARKRSASSAPSLPSKRQILEFIADSPGPVGKREIARAFGIRGNARIALKALLKELRDEGALDGGRKRRLRPAGALPPVMVVEVTGTDADGEVLCRPGGFDEDEDGAAAPVIYLRPEGGRGAAPGPGDRVLVRLEKIGPATYEAQTIRVLGAAPSAIIGVYERRGANGAILPTARGRQREFIVAPADSGGARDGEVVKARTLSGSRRARVVERLGPISDPQTYSLIAIHSRDIPVEFPHEAVAQADAAGPLPAPAAAAREDLRGLPLVTIDGADARDFDDAVWAAPDDGPGAEKSGGWRIVVAIADVAWYVRPGDALDRAAYERGTSVYFPDRVVPMLPEALSNGWCSLVPGEDRPCIAAHIRLAADGSIREHRFSRAVMRSAARLTYAQVQRARDGTPDDATASLGASVIEPLYGAFAALSRARARRGALDLDLPELAIEIGADGHVARVTPRPRLDSHRLIEEFMITANVAAAQSLEAKGQPVLYRAHEPPSSDKLEALRESLAALGYKLQPGAVRPAHLAGIVRQAAAEDRARLVSELILRSQSKATYSPENPGHFGLALTRYCHFTSPIRRYPDLLIHRALIAAHGLGEDGLPADVAARLEEIGERVSITERRAEAAERDATDRYLTAYLADRVGAEFHGRISGVTRFGLFVTLDDTGADGLVPVSTLQPRDYYDHDEAQHRLVGRDTGHFYALGASVVVALREANVNTGGLVFEVLEGGSGDGAAGGGERKAGRQRARGPGRGPGRGPARGPGGSARRRRSRRRS